MASPLMFWLIGAGSLKLGRMAVFLTMLPLVFFFNLKITLRMYELLRHIPLFYLHWRLKQFFKKCQFLAQIFVCILSINITYKMIFFTWISFSYFRSNNYKKFKIIWSNPFWIMLENYNMPEIDHDKTKLQIHFTAK